MFSHPMHHALYYSLLEITASIRASSVAKTSTAGNIPMEASAPATTKSQSQLIPRGASGIGKGSTAAESKQVSGKLQTLPL